MDLKSFTQAIQQIAEEKGIAMEKIVEAIEMALAAAYKRDYGERGQIIRAKLDPITGHVTMTQIKIVVDETMIKSEEEVQTEEEERLRKLQEGIPERRLREEEEEIGSEEGAVRKIRFNPEKHLMLADAQKVKLDIKPEEELEFPLETHEEYGRIAAQTAKQVIIQRIREIEREAVFDEFKNREGEVASGLIQRMEGRTVFIDIGRTVGVLPPEEQIPYERYQAGTRIKVLITLVEKNPKGPGIFLSRSHPRLLRKLFEIEVPEIASGVVEIKAVAREPGSRSKVAVVSHEEGVDPVGSLVGQKGIRVSTVINELGGEKIDVIEWAEDSAEFLGNALSPAKVVAVEINDRRHEARAIVPDEQLSLAIGKGGQNVRLAAKLTGWKIDVRSNKQAAVVEEAPPEEAHQDIKEENILVATPENIVESPEKTVSVSGEDLGEEKKEKSPKKKRSTV